MELFTLVLTVTLKHHTTFGIAWFIWSVEILVATVSCAVSLYANTLLASAPVLFAFMSDSVHVGVALQVPPQVVETGVSLGTDLAVVRSHP